MGRQYPGQRLCISSYFTVRLKCNFLGLDKVKNWEGVFFKQECKVVDLFIILVLQGRILFFQLNGAGAANIKFNCNQQSIVPPGHTKAVGIQ